MNKITALLLLVLVVSAGLFVIGRLAPSIMTGAPPYDIGDEAPADLDPYAWIRDWVRPEGAARVGLQVGHWKNEELPEELSRLIGNTGSSGGGKSEWEVNLAIAQATAELLRSKGVVVDILPATVPEKYWADVFVAIHADGSTDKSASGFKAASPRRDFTNLAGQLVDSIEASYSAATQLPKDDNVTRNMRGYYAFAWWRYSHAVHPMTAAAILETGFLTSAGDRKTIVNNHQLAAQGLANGILEYLTTQDLI